MKLIIDNSSREAVDIKTLEVGDFFVYFLDGKDVGVIIGKGKAFDLRHKKYTDYNTYPSKYPVFKVEMKQIIVSL